MNRLGPRVERLEARIKPPVQRNSFWITYDPRETDLTYDEFVAAERRRLGVAEGDWLIVWHVVKPNRLKQIKHARAGSSCYVAGALILHS